MRIRFDNQSTAKMGCLQTGLVIASIVLAGCKQIEALPSPSLKDARASLSNERLKQHESTLAADEDKVDHLPGLPGKLDSNLYSGHATVFFLPFLR